MRRKILPHPVGVLLPQPGDRDVGPIGPRFNGNVEIREQFFDGSLEVHEFRLPRHADNEHAWFAESGEDAETLNPNVKRGMRHRFERRRNPIPSLIVYFTDKFQRQMVSGRVDPASLQVLCAKCTDLACVGVRDG